MALEGYFVPVGVTQGQIKGPVTQAGREDQIAFIAFNHKVVSKKDIRSGRSVGLRQHGEVNLTMCIGPQTPLLYQALCTNEKFETVTLYFWDNDDMGQQVQHFTITLSNASIAGMRTEMLNTRYSENANHPERDQVSFSYQKIEWTWNDGGLSASDDWETQAGA